ncbi:MurR/RpiR family transcriptional regulator [Cryobacterium sp. TMT1-66-1]|uniref:MurR/RpiR family transcriptional regulator n=1 Tax=Cryobacterium sp. TMT1-66-1 TaxID=1259242 RepID=UPI00141BF1F8|nr:MurR/RpiR family transcriptional regulator [Cryobacterium sp. TMT1-66-1]
MATIKGDPAAASYLSAQKLADRSSVNVATVVRTAQFLGFSGWPAMKSELRHRYLATMTSEGLLAEHSAPAAGLTQATIAADVRNLTVIARTIDSEQVKRVAGIIAAARRTAIVASGSYAAPGIQLSHMGQTMGHDIELLTSSGTSLVNRIKLLGAGDCFLACNLWRSSRFVFSVAEIAKARGARIVVLADRRSALSDLADEALIVPSEGVSFVPSIVGAVSVVQAILAELATINPEQTTAALRDVEALWAALDLVEPV